MKADLNMNNHDINVQNPTKDDSPVNFGYLKGLELLLLGLSLHHIQNLRERQNIWTSLFNFSNYIL